MSHPQVEHTALSPESGCSPWESESLVGDNPTNSSENLLSASPLIQHSMFLPFLSIRIRPACLSSLMWCERVDGATLSSSPSWPTKRRASGSETHLVPGGQHEANRRKTARRWGFPRALNISASRSTSIFLLFDIFRSIESFSPMSRKKLIARIPGTPC
jgi:hypothetical protein